MAEWYNVVRKLSSLAQAPARVQTSGRDISNYTFLIPTIHFTISVTETILQEHSQNQEEQLWSSGLGCQDNCKEPMGSTPSLCFAVALTF